MRIRLATELDVDATRAWDQVQRRRLLEYVAWPVIVFRFHGDPPDRWRTGWYTVSMRFLGLIPLGRQVIDLERPPSEGD